MPLEKIIVRTREINNIAKKTDLERLFELLGRFNRLGKVKKMFESMDSIRDGQLGQL